MQVFTHPGARRSRGFSKHISMYYVDFNHLSAKRVPNGFERDLQGRLTHLDVDLTDFKSLLESLDDRDRVLVEEFCMGYTQQELSERFGLSQQTVSRLLRQVGNRLHRMVRGLPWRGEAAQLPFKENSNGSGTCSWREENAKE